jgi:hypothetical protein
MIGRAASRVRLRTIACRMSELPAAAAWRHLDARAGFEVVFLLADRGGFRCEGHATAVEDGVAWSVLYTIALDRSWTTLRAQVRNRSMRGSSDVRLEREEPGRWQVDGAPVPELDGCCDVDLEASAFTNAFPVRRLGLAVGDRAEAPAAYVRAPGLEVERLEQSYLRLADDGERMRYDYASPAFDFRALLVYDAQGLVLEYPGIAERVL